MKSLLILALGLLVFSATKASGEVDSSLPTATSNGKSIEMIVVAEQSNEGKKSPQPTPERPAYYLAYDGGYIETGGVVAGLKPPSAGAVGHTLKAALVTQGYQPATAQTPPSVVLVYHWGTVRRERYASGNGDFLTKPLNADQILSFVLPSRYVRYDKGRVKGEVFQLEDSGLPVSGLRSLSGAVEPDRSFVIVTAYDYADLQRRQKTLLWRVKLSAGENSAQMADALPALINAGAPYFGRDFNQSQLSSAPLVSTNRTESADVASAPFVIPAELTGQFDESLVRDITAREFNEFTDGPLAPVNDKLWFKTRQEPNTPTSAAAPGNQAAEIVVIAEQTPAGERTAASPPIVYIACDAGYIEAGDPIAGLKPPSAAAVGHALRSALGSVGYELATTQTSPAVLLVYSYGLIAPEKYAGSPQDISLNLMARLNLVATKRGAERARDYLIYQVQSNIASMPPDIQLTMDYARDSRYFLIVSAYDYADLSRQTPTLLWRVKLSAQDNRGAPGEILPALAQASGPFLGRNFDDRQFSGIPRNAESARFESQALSSAPFVNPRKAVEQIYPVFINQILPQERATVAATPQKSRRLTLPPQLADRITAYLQEKAALRDILEARLKTAPAGPETQRAIDAFNAEHAERILRLGQTYDDLRIDLSRFSATLPHSADKSLDALLREFGAEIR